ncbi:MAG: methyltransferase [Caldilineaceae bacterium]
MPLMPNFLERTLFLTLNQGPAPMLDLWSGPAFRIVLAAIRLHLFEALTAGPTTAVDLAQQLQIDPHATSLLLNALAPLGYVKMRGNHYLLTPMSRKWLTADGAIDLRAFYRYWGALMEEFFPRLEESIRTGKPPVNLYEWIEEHPAVSRDFQEGMIALTRYVQADVVKGITLPATAKRLVDVGGGHAAYSIALCQKYPQLHATILDSPQALITGIASITDADINNRITTRTGNFFTDELGLGYDVVLLFNIIHGLTTEQNIDLLRKAKAALAPGGQVIILEQIPGSTPLPMSETAVRILGLSFFHLLGGQAYTFAEIQDWLSRVGFGAIRRTNIAKAGSALVTGSLPG